MVCKDALFAQFRYSAQLCATPKQAQHEQAPVLIALGRLGNPVNGIGLSPGQLTIFKRNLNQV